MTYINPRGKVFAHMDRLVGWQQGGTPAPVCIDWDLSSRCPLGCQSCHFAYTHTRGPWTGRNRRLPMAFDGVGDLADHALVCTALMDARRIGVRSLVWSGGGEPTTHPEWQNIVAFAASLGFDQGMYTMGGLLTDASAELLARCATWVVVSLDTADAATYAREKGVPPSRFEAACSGVRKLAQTEETVVGASFLLHEKNWHRATDMLELSRELGATYATFRPTIDTSPDRPSVSTVNREWVNDAEEMLEALEQEPDVEIDPDRFRSYRDWISHGYKACYGIRLVTTVTPDGRVWLCPNRRGMPDSCLGDLRVEDFETIWSRHPGVWTSFENCRVMCRLHPVNETLAAIEQPRTHEAFV